MKLSPTKVKAFVSNKKWLFALYALLAIVASMQSLLGGRKTFMPNGIEYTKYNNYVIFKQSYFHLAQGKDLYCHYPQEHWDLYKYTPTFAAAFGALAVLPDWAGLTLWNLLNALVLLLGVYALRGSGRYAAGIILLICASETMGALQNSQSNALVAGLLMLAFGLMQRGKTHTIALAALCIAASAYVKLFGVIGFALCLLFPHKLKTALYSLMWLVILFALPLIFVNIQQYGALWASYGSMLAGDHDASYGYSVMGCLHTWFGLDVNKNAVVGMKMKSDKLIFVKC